ncbi:MAG: hypothetical protein ACOC0S_03170, partial [Desulfohalobiaceae bacterium]
LDGLQHFLVNSICLHFPHLAFFPLFYMDNGYQLTDIKDLRGIRQPITTTDNTAFFPCLVMAISRYGGQDVNLIALTTGLGQSHATRMLKSRFQDRFVGPRQPKK